MTNFKYHMTNPHPCTPACPAGRPLHFMERGSRVERGGVRWICFVIWILLFGFPLPAAAVTVNVQMDGTNQVIKDHDGNAMPVGNVIQIICASEETIHSPSENGGTTGGDAIVWTGAVGAGGMEIDGAFIKAFAGGQSLTNGGRIYVRGWNNAVLSSATYYGDSVLSETLEAGEPPMPGNWSVPSFETTTIFTPEAEIYMIIEGIWVNGYRFRSGDPVSKQVTLEVMVSSEPGVSYAELQLDVLHNHQLILISKTPPHEKWGADFTIPPASEERHIMVLHFKDNNYNDTYTTVEAIIKTGGVQVVGRPNNYPNPFSPMSGGSTAIQYTLSTDATITIMIYDITGREVKRMKYTAGAKGARGGTNQAEWNGTSLGGEVVGNGMYLYKIISGNEVIGSGKLVVND